jgi:hypothetical protein
MVWATTTCPWHREKGRSNGSQWFNATCGRSGRHAHDRRRRARAGATGRALSHLACRSTVVAKDDRLVCRSPAGDKRCRRARMWRRSLVGLAESAEHARGNAGHGTSIGARLRNDRQPPRRKGEVFRLCNLQVSKCQGCRRRHRCRGALPAIARRDLNWRCARPDQGRGRPGRGTDIRSGYRRTRRERAW